MAKKKFKKMGNIADTEGSNFGNYKESKGGGSPKGGIWGGESGRVGWEKRVEKGEVKDGQHRKSQPRTDDGKFTYNSVNGKETKWDGRGKTVNPLLTNGENGIYIKDVKKQFEKQEGSLYERFKGRFYRKGSEKIVQQKNKYTTKIAGEDVWEIAKYSWSIEKGRFGGGQKGQTIDEQDAFKESKRGRSSSRELDAKELARKLSKEVYVMDDKGGIATKDKKVSTPAPAPEKTSEKVSTPTSTSTSTTEKAPATTPAPASTLEKAPTSKQVEDKIYKFQKERPLKAGSKYNLDEVKKAKDIFMASDEIDDEDKRKISSILETGSKEDIDGLVDVLRKVGKI